MRRFGLGISAALAVALLALLAWYSPDRQRSLAEHVAAGTMRDLSAADVARVRVVAGERAVSFQRGGEGWQSADGAAVDAATATAIEAGLRLLHNAPPERGFDTESPEFGLTPPALRVSLVTRDGATFEAEFGHTNPIGLARYVRIREHGRGALHLLPGYVAEPWERIAAMRQP